MLASASMVDAPPAAEVDRLLASLEPPPSVERPEIPAAPVVDRRLRYRPRSSEQLGVLDDLLVQTTFNCFNEIVGAPTPVQVSAAIADLLRANDHRHQSWYVAGLYHALLGLGDPRLKPQDTVAVDAQRWYMAGRVAGLVHKGLYSDVVHLHSGDEICSKLGDSGKGPSEEAAPGIVSALWDCGKESDAIAFLSANAVAASESIRQRLTDMATKLLADRHFTDARAAWDLLAEAVKVAEESSDSQIPASKKRLINRRRAHIRRMNGEFEAATALLNELVTSEDEEDEIRSMAQTDINLMAAGVRELADLRLSTDRGKAKDLASRIAAQREGFEKALALDPEGGPHAHYVLGFLALLQDKGELAANQLQRAVSAFRARPEIYSRQNLLDQAVLHHALAVCLAGAEHGEVREAARHLIDSTADELRIPDWMLDPVLTAVGSQDIGLAEELFNSLMDQRESEVVETLSSLASDLPAVALALLHRADQEGVPVSRKVNAARTALPALLKSGNDDAAERAFEILFEHAREGEAREEMLRLLKDEEDALTAICDNEDLVCLRAELHARAGERATAVALRAEVARQYLSSSDPWRRAEAGGVIKLLEEYPEADGEIIGPLAEQWKRFEGGLGAPAAPAATRSIRLLVVGGNEEQAKYSNEIQSILRKDAPNISVEFIPTGWTSSWGELASQVADKLDKADGMVLHYFVRTGFGRKVRKAAGIWCSVVGHGRDGILRGIYHCADMVSNRSGTAAESGN